MSASRSGHVYPIDRFLHAGEARLTAGLSAASAMAACLDWLVHLANSPGKQAERVQKALRKQTELGGCLLRAASAGSAAAGYGPLCHAPGSYVLED